jgi:hypothetical protein
MATKKKTADMTVIEARRQLEEIHATLKGQAEAAGNTDFANLIDAVVRDITDEELQRGIDTIKEQEHA